MSGVKTAGQKEGAGLLERVTPWPWHVVGNSVRCTATAAKVAEVQGGGIGPGMRAARDANAELIALAPDHALLLRALMMGAAIRISDRSIRLGMEAHCCALDAAGCPALDDNLRAALRKVVGSNG
jgi:hypothetical protein